MIGELTLDDDAVATLSDEGEWGSDTPELLHVLDQSFHPVRDAEMADHHRPFGVAALDRAAFALGLEVRLSHPVGPDPMDDAAAERDGGGGTTNAALYELSDEYTRAEARDVARAVLAGYANDKSAEQVSKVLQKQLGIPAAQADVLATTELTRVAAADQLSDARVAAEARGRRGKVRFISKDRSCPLCQALHGRVYTLEKAQDVIPVHPHCTCRWQPVVGPTKNVFCPTGEGGGIDPSCGKGKGRIPARQRRILDQIDEIMTTQVREFHSTRVEKEKKFGFALVPPTEVNLRDLKGTIKSSDLDALVAAGLVERRNTPTDVKLKRTGIPPDFYDPPV